MKRKTQITVRLDEDDFLRLKIEAERLGVPIVDAIRIIIRENFNRKDFDTINRLNWDEILRMIAISTETLKQTFLESLNAEETDKFIEKVDKRVSKMKR